MSQNKGPNKLTAVQMSDYKVQVVSPVLLKQRGSGLWKTKLCKLSLVSATNVGGWKKERCRRCLASGGDDGGG